MDTKLDGEREDAEEAKDTENAVEDSVELERHAQNLCSSARTAKQGSTFVGLAVQLLSG